MVGGPGEKVIRPRRVQRGRSDALWSGAAALGLPASYAAVVEHRVGEVRLDGAHIPGQPY